MLTGIDATETVDYVSKFEKTTENPTIFVLGVLTNREKLKLFGSSMNAKGEFDLSKFQEKAIDIIMAGLKSIKNLTDAKTKQPVDVPIEKVLDVLPFDVLMELFEKIMSMNFLSESERKN